MGVEEGFDPELVLPDLSLSIDACAIAPWKGASATATKKRMAPVAEFLDRAKLAASTPLTSWPAGRVQQLLTGDGKGFLGLLLLLEHEFATTSRPATQEKLAGFRGAVTCPDCGGAAPA